MGAPLRPRPRLPEMEQLALALLRKGGVRMLVIDELHNVLAGNSVNRREFLNLLRFLGNELRIPLVGVGTRDAYLAIRSDDQLENRFEPMMLPVWEANDDCRSEEHTSELQSRGHLVCRLLLEKKKIICKVVYNHNLYTHVI